MYYKNDWDKAKERLLAWWQHEVVDRCCIAVHAPRKTSKMLPFPPLNNGPWLGGLDQFADDDQESINQWWMDPQQNYNRMITWFENTYFGGEALPVTYVNWGAMSMAAMLGSPAKFKKTSVWYPEVIKDWDAWEWNFDKKTDFYWQTILSIMECLIENCHDRYLIGKPELGCGADVLSLLRGMDKMAMDLYLHPDEVHQGVDFISDMWVDLMEDMHQMTTAANQGGDVLAWMGLWAPGKVDQIACDFSAIISPDMFKEFFVPEIKKMGDWCEYGVYHLDGPACMKNMLDSLLEIDQLKTIQFTYGAGSPPTYSPQYIPAYKKILASGRQLYLLVQPHEVEPILSELPIEGLFMRVYVNTEDEANEMLKKVEQWSVQKTTIRVG